MPEMTPDGCRGHGDTPSEWSSIQRQLFQGEEAVVTEEGQAPQSDKGPAQGSTPSPQVPPDVLDEAIRSSKQPGTASFKDTLLKNGGDGEPNSPMGDPEIEVNPEDVSFTLEGLVPSVTFSARIRSLLEQEMELAVIIKILGRFIRQETLYGKIMNMWKPSGRLKLTELEGGCYMAKFDNSDDYHRAVLGGPWVVFGHYLTVHPWEPSISPLNLEITSVFGWVRLPGLPYHYYHKNVLRTIGEAIGKVIRIDYNTAEVEKARFARLAVRLDLTKPLVSMFKIDGVTQFVEYEGLPTICFHCGCYGHLENTCPLKLHQRQQGHEQQSSAAPTAPATPVMDETPAAIRAREIQQKEKQLFGEWMQVPSRGARRYRSSKKPSDNPASATLGGSRFGVLATSDTVAEQERDPTQSTQLTTQERDKPRGEKVGHKTTQPLKASVNKGKKAGVRDHPPQTVQNNPSTESLFVSQAYKVSRDSTTLNQSNHSVVSIQDIPKGPAHSDSTGQAAIGPAPQKPTPLPKEGNEHLITTLKPPDPAPSPNGVKIQPNVKLKHPKMRIRDHARAPSEELTNALHEALGASANSDDDLRFVEATETTFDEDTGSEQSEMDF